MDQVLEGIMEFSGGDHVSATFAIEYIRDHPELVTPEVKKYVSTKPCLICACIKLLPEEHPAYDPRMRILKNKDVCIKHALETLLSRKDVTVHIASIPEGSPLTKEQLKQATQEDLESWVKKGWLQKFE